MKNNFLKLEGHSFLSKLPFLFLNIFPIINGLLLLVMTGLYAWVIYTDAKAKFYWTGYYRDILYTCVVALIISAVSIYSQILLIKHTNKKINEHGSNLKKKIIVYFLSYFALFIFFCLSGIGAIFPLIMSG